MNGMRVERRVLRRMARRMVRRMVGVGTLVALMALGACDQEDPEAYPYPEEEPAPAASSGRPASGGQSHLGAARGAAENTVSQMEAHNARLEKELADQ